MLKLLILNDYHSFPVRQTVWDHLYSFARYSDGEVYYFNTAAGELPQYLLNIPFDAIIFHTAFLSSRWNPALFQANISKVSQLKHHPALKVAIPQDEFIHTDALCNFINEFKMDLVYSIYKPCQWPKIYGSVDFSRTKFGMVLAGYVEEALTKSPPPQIDSRPIDIGYRAWKAAPWLGRHGQKKVIIGEKFKRAGRGSDLSLDISLEDKDVLKGKAWPQFLKRCKTTIGVEGGASILDKDGTLKTITEEYLERHPNASFEEIERNCFPSRDGELDASVITPRHFECCLTGTCQILLEGEYNNVLKPNVHYLEVKKDFSNLNEVMEKVRDTRLLHTIATNAYRDVVASGKYSYRRFVQGILNDVKALQQERGIHLPENRHTTLQVSRKLGDRKNWLYIAIKEKWRGTKSKLGPVLRRLLPDPWFHTLRRLSGGQR